MNDNCETLAKELENALIERHGLMVSSRSLWKILGYLSSEAWRKAIQRKTIPIPIFQIPDRHGYFALSCEVAAWVAKQRMTECENLEAINQTDAAPVIPESHQDEFISVLVNLASGCSPEPAKDAQMLLRMMSKEFKDKVLDNYSSSELRAILSVSYESKVK